MLNTLVADMLNIWEIFIIKEIHYFEKKIIFMEKVFNIKKN